MSAEASLSPRMTYSLAAPLGVGGMGRSMFCSVRAALAEGWPVRVLSSPGGERPPEAEVIELDTSRRMALAQMTPLRYAPAWLRWIKERGHDRLARCHVGQSQVFQGSVLGCLDSLRAARRAGALTIVESQCAHARHMDRVLRQEEEAVGSWQHFHNRWTVSRFEREYAEADYVYCYSKYARRTLLEEGVPVEKVFNIPVSVEMPERAAIHREDDKFRVLFVGYLSLIKGFRYLLAAWKMLGLRDAELYLRGGTGDRCCRRILTDWRRRMEFTVDSAYGLVPYDQFSVLVLPSLTDSFGQVVLEAMAAGLPVVVSQNVGAAECVREGVDGYVVPVGDPEALVERLRTLCGDRELLARMGRAARERAAEYSFETFRARYAAAIRKILGT
jgi:glycosyltransferase involved in cell wall biosynthesis